MWSTFFSWSRFYPCMDSQNDNKYKAILINELQNRNGFNAKYDLGLNWILLRSHCIYLYENISIFQYIYGIFYCLIIMSQFDAYIFILISIELNKTQLCTIPSLFFFGKPHAILNHPFTSVSFSYEMYALVNVFIIHGVIQVSVRAHLPTTSFAPSKIPHHTEHTHDSNSSPPLSPVIVLNNYVCSACEACVVHRPHGNHMKCMLEQHSAVVNLFVAL